MSSFVGGKKKADFIKWILERGRFDRRGRLLAGFINRGISLTPLKAWERLITKQNTTFDEVFLKVCVVEGGGVAGGGGSGGEWGDC